MRIREIHTSNGYTNGLGTHDFNSNKIDIITGANGSGKTILLNSILQFFMEKPKTNTFFPSVIYTINNTNYRDPEEAKPLKLVAQTFSPFSRFPSPKPTQKSILESYTTESLKEIDEYICAGIHRGTRSIGPNLSKAILESSIFRFSQSSEYAEALAHALSILKFSSRLSFKYSSKKILSDIFIARDRATAILKLIEEATNSAPIGAKPRSPLGIEASLSDHVALAGLIESAMEQLERTTVDYRQFELSIDFNNRRLLDFSTLQSLALLRRLGLLKIVNCFIGAEQHPSSDISYSSSGQQQILCSLLSLVSSLSDGAVVLIDEPELSLHPTWQQLYFDILLASITPFKNCHVIVATHSPLIVQRAQNSDAGVIRMGTNDRGVDLKDERASVEDALLDIFETPITDSVEMASKIFDAVTQAEGGSKSERNLALEKLKRLQHIYSDGPTRSDKDLAMINDAYRMLSEN
jgi:ABC-type lipoprotein export system ATPase subunit